MRYLACPTLPAGEANPPTVQTVKLSVIINPAAGSANKLDSLMREIEKLKPASVGLTRKKGDAQILTENAIRQHCDYIIAAGGDGTLNEVINGVARTNKKVRVGLLPLGTGNDFARCLKLPASLEDNIRILKRARTRLLDLVRVRSTKTRYFINVSAGGFSGLVNEKLTPQIKHTWGPLAYVRSAAAAFADMRAYHATVQLDDERISMNLFNMIVANGQYVAGGLPVAPRARISDGLLDVVLIPEISKSELVLLATQIALGRHLHSRSLKFCRAKKVVIRSKPGMWFNVDGEPVGNVPARFEVLPQAIHFVTGRSR